MASGRIYDGPGVGLLVVNAPTHHLSLVSPSDSMAKSALVDSLDWCKHSTPLINCAPVDKC